MRSSTLEQSLTAVPQLVSVPSLPLEEPVLVFTVALVAFLVAPITIERFGVPGIVGIVLVGAAIGPNGIGLLAETDAIVLLGSVGLIYLLFTVGLELDLHGFKRSPEDAAIFGVTSFALPFVVGTVVGVELLGLDPWASALLAAVFASHTLLAYPIVNSLNITKNPAVTAVFGGILFTDTFALVVLAIALGAVDGGLTAMLFVEVFVSLALLFGGVWLVVPRIGRWFFRNLSQESYFEFLFVVAAFFAAASFAELLDIAPILGAFVAGLALNRLVPKGGTLMSRIEFVGNAFFIPFFLLHVGMLVDPAVILDGISTVAIAATIILVMFGTKFVAAWLVGIVQGYSTDERLVIFGLSTGQAAAALAITLIGFDRGLFGAEVLNAVVLMLLVSAIVSPFVTERAGSRLAVSGDVEPDDDRSGDPRVLLPLSHYAEQQERLLELAFVLKGGEKREPVHVLRVIEPDDPTTREARVEAALTELSELTEIGGAAEVEVQPEARVNHNIASGIVRGGVETGADVILMGWDAARPLSQRVFGTIIDQVLERSSLPVLVSRLGHPINTTETIHVVLPAGIDHHAGFFEAVHLLKRLANQLGASLSVLVVDGRPHQYEGLFELIETDVPATFESVDSWSEVGSLLTERADENDLVVGLSPRRGSVGWHPQLAALPRRLAELPPRSFIVIHPREGDPDYDATFLKLK